MFKKLSYYRSALYLTLVIAAIDLAFFAYGLNYSVEKSFPIATRIAISIVIAFGLWIYSKTARYLGALWFTISVISVIWPLFFGDRIVLSIGLLWLFAIGTLSLVTLYLLLSKTFGIEFSGERNIQPSYKAILRKVFVILLIIAVVIATLNDIYNLALG